MEENIRTVAFNWTVSVYHFGTHVLTSGFVVFFSCLTVCSVVWLYLYVYDVYLFGSFFYWNINWLLCVLLGILQMWIVRGNGRQLALFSSQQQFTIYHAKLFTIIMAYLPSDLNGDRKKRLEFKDIKSVVI
jgi:hypothetical protein